MRIMWLVLGALLFAGVGTAAASARVDSTAKPTTQEKETPDPHEPAQEEAAEDYSSLTKEESLEKVKELGEQFNHQLDEFRKKFQAAPAEEKAKLRSEMPKPDALVEKFQKLAELHPQSDVEAQALLWIVQHQRSGEVYDQSLAILVERHAGLTELKPIVMMMQYQPPSAKTNEFFQKLRDNGAARELGAVATYAYLQYQKRAAELKTNLAENAETAKRYEEAYGKEQVEFLQQMTSLSEDELLAELEKLVAESGDVVLSGERTLASAIEGDIFELKFLQVGKEVPDIEGEDIDGTEFKLSDYRGKVVVIDFWGDW